jgi:glutamyl-tRNA synthetase
MTTEYERMLDQALRLRDRGPSGRYAPSPSGPLHLGNARTALLAWLQTRLAGGRFIMRMEDLDRSRVRPGCAKQIVDDLRWMGLDWDEGPDIGGETGPYEQSARDDIYAVALSRLREAHSVFPCFCSRKDIRQAASAPHGPDEPIYPGTCRERDSAFEEQVRRSPALRYRVRAGRIEVEDVVTGAIVQDLSRDVGDFVVRRSDGVFAYQFAVVVDDALMGVTDVVRGVDLCESTPRQLALLRELDLPAPRYWHVPLMADDDGNRMSKRDGSESVMMFRARGGQPAELVGQLAASTGLCPLDTPVSAQELLSAHDLSSFTDVLRDSGTDSRLS